MIRSLLLSMVHSCNVLSTTQDQKLNFSSGAVVFSVGELLAGADSDATGTVKTIVLESGAWATENAVGYLILSNVSGTFQAGELISDEAGCEGIASATQEPVTNSVGTPQLTTTSTPYGCRFSQSSGGSIINLDSGDYIVSEPLLFLPSDAVIQEGDTVTSSESGYQGPYQVMHVETLYELFTDENGNPLIDHLEVNLKAVEKTS